MINMERERFALHQRKEVILNRANDIKTLKAEQLHEHPSTSTKSIDKRMKATQKKMDKLVDKTDRLMKRMLKEFTKMEKKNHARTAFITYF